MIVGEVALQDLHRVVGYLESGDQLHLAHNFVFVELPWDSEAFRTSIEDFEALADRAAWPAWFLSNHDISRAAARTNAVPASPAPWFWGSVSISCARPKRFANPTGKSRQHQLICKIAEWKSRVPPKRR